MLIIFFVQVTINIYYDSSDLNSQTFITKQLQPAMKNFKNNVDLNLIPFGNGFFRTYDKNTIFFRNDEEDECFDNKFHAYRLHFLFDGKSRL